MKVAILGYQLLICRLYQLKNRFKSELSLVAERLASLRPSNSSRLVQPFTEQK